MSYPSDFKNSDSHDDSSQATGPFGLGTFGWIIVGALIGIVILLAAGQTQAPLFALGGVGAGLGLILGTCMGRTQPPDK